MSTHKQESTASTIIPEDNPISDTGDVVLVYKTYYKSFEWKRRLEIDALRANGETILRFPVLPRSSMVWITVSWCLQDTYDDDDEDDGYNDGECE